MNLSTWDYVYIQIWMSSLTKTQKSMQFFLPSSQGSHGHGKKFKSIDQSEAVQMAMREIAAVFMADPEVEAVTFHDDFPL